MRTGLWGYILDASGTMGHKRISLLQRYSSSTLDKLKVQFRVEQFGLEGL